VRSYIPRRKWTDFRPILLGMHVPSPNLYIHHDAGAGPDAWDDAEIVSEKQYMRGIESLHINQRKMRAVAYSFVIFPSGRVYEGRGWGKIGGHTENLNDNGHGICWVGNFENRKPTKASLRAARRLIRRGKMRRKVTWRANVLGHRDTKPTACPGRNLYAVLGRLRRLFRVRRGKD